MHFRLGMTSWAWIWALAILAGGVYLMWLGYGTWLGFHPLDPDRLYFALPPALMGAVMGLTGLLSPLLARGKVEVDGSGVRCRTALGREVHFAWGQLMVAVTDPPTMGLRRVVLFRRTGGGPQIVLHELLFPQFNVFLEEVQRNRERYTQVQKGGSVPLD